MGETWWHAGLGLVALAVAGLLVVHCLVVRAGAARDVVDRQACTAHTFMAAAMAGMFWPAIDVVPAAAGAVVFALLAAWFLVVRLRRRTRGDQMVDEPLHLVISSVAMVVMYLGMHGAGHDAGAGGHAAHGGGTGTMGAGWLLAVGVGLACAGYFAWHAWETVVASRPSGPDPSDASPSGRIGVLSTTRALTAAHVVLDGLMAVMFLGAL